MHGVRKASAAGAVFLFGPLPLVAVHSSGGPPPPPTSPPLAMRIEVGGQAPEAAHAQVFGALRAPLQREIVDPCLGTHWQLVADALHPERPGRLVPLDSPAFRQPSPSGAIAGSALPASPAGTLSVRSFPVSSSSVRRSSDGTPASLSAAPPAIRAGDRVTVWQHTAILDARFAAVALESAQLGQRLRVRLLGGGNRTGNLGAIVDVQATSAGAATWLAVDRDGQ